MASIKRNPNQSNINKTAKKIDKLAARYKADFVESLNSGNSPEVSARIAYEKTDWNGAIREITVGGARESVKRVSAGIRFDKKKFLAQEYDGVTLSDRIASIGELSSAAVGDAIREQLAVVTSWNRVAKAVERTGQIKSDPSGAVSRLSSWARQAWAGNDPAAIRAYEKELALFRRQADRLLDDPTAIGGLRRAYQRVIRATESGSEESLKKAIDNVVKRKMAYNSQRIARTEMMKAWGKSTIAEYKSDTDLGGIQWVTTLDERTCEECAGIASEDIGYGPGMYPFGKIPSYPVHPNCACGLLPVEKTVFEN